jgi:L-alanine-DL-glutamate epimerase-like enolase superfamily enzyme
MRWFPVREPVSGNRYAVLRVKTKSGFTGWGECAQTPEQDAKALEKEWLGKPATLYVLQPDINHVGGITGLSRVSQMAAVSGISMAPHACEDPLGGLATLHVNSAMPNFVVQEICGQIQPGPTDKIWEEWLDSQPCEWWTDGSLWRGSQA